MRKFALLIFTVGLSICSVFGENVDLFIGLKRVRRKLGESCSDMEHCDGDAWLTCTYSKTLKRSICACAFQDGMLYLDKKGGNCYAMVDKKCKYEVLLKAENGQELGSGAQTAECVEHAFCAMDGKCQCVSTYSPSINGTCAQQEATSNQSATYPSGKGDCNSTKVKANNCSHNEECGHNLTCFNGKCDCDPEVSVAYNGESFTVSLNNSDLELVVFAQQGTCLSKVESYCSVTAAASLIQNGSAGANIYCHPSAICDMTTNKCKCRADTYPTRGGFCGSGYLSSCLLDYPCTDNLVCTREQSQDRMQCRCPNPDYEEYDDEIMVGSCVGGCKSNGVVGARCDPAIDGGGCIRNAKCVSSTRYVGINGTGFECECKDGFIENAFHACEVEYGYPCNVENDEDRCDALAELRCSIVPRIDITTKQINLEQVCSCNNLDDVYSYQKRKCLRSNQLENTYNAGTGGSDLFGIVRQFHEQGGWCDIQKKNSNFN